jgi:hypothetical protein
MMALDDFGERFLIAFLKAYLKIMLSIVSSYCQHNFNVPVIIHYGKLFIVTNLPCQNNEIVAGNNLYMYIISNNFT